MAAPYPKRPQYFAHKFCRQLIKQAVAQEIGPDGFCLLTCVAMTEDAKGYTGAVTFFNGQLMPLCGFTTEKRLIAVRQRCVEAGWLHYEPGGKGIAGKYWCVLPFAARNDGPVDENPEEFALSKSTGEVQEKFRETTGKVTGEVQENDREKTGEPTVILPIPKPVPIPDPKEIHTPACEDVGVAFEVAPGVRVDWLIEESAFMARWNATEGVTHYPRTNIPQELVRAFQDRFLTRGWIDRAHKALAKFPLASGNTMTLGTFLRDGKVDEILGGSNDWTPGRGRASPGGGRGGASANKAEGERLKEQLRAQRSRNADGQADRVPRLAGPDDEC